MALHLSVPAMEGKPLVPAETHPAVVQGMLAVLPAEHPVAAAQALQEPLALLNRQMVSSDKRFKLLELYRPEVLRVAQELAALYCGQPLPLPDHALMAAEAARTLFTELAYGYKHTVIDLGSRVLALGKGKMLPTLIQRAIHSLDQLLLVSYHTYTSAPDGVWSELHKLYLHAAQNGLQDVAVSDTDGETSVNLAYKRALLLALASPHRLPAGSVDMVREYLARYAHLAQLQPLGIPENPAGIFLVRLKSDSPPIPLSKHTGEADMRTDILLITIELARQVSMHAAELQKGESPAKLGLPESAHDHHYQDVLGHLLKHWALAPKRTYTRQSKNESINLCAGLAAAYYFLNGEKDGTAFVDKTDETAISLNFTDSPIDTGSAHRYGTARWLVVNESAGGMALSEFPGAGSTLKVGEILGLRDDRSKQWSLGVVRWASGDDPASLTIGAQMLAPYAKAVTVRAEGEGQFERALQLPQLLPVKQPASLVTACGVYRPARKLEIKQDGGNRSKWVLATRLLERTASFERFQYSEL